MIVAQILVAWVLAFLALELTLYWATILAVRRRGPYAERAPSVPMPVDPPRFCVLTSCRDGAACIPGFIQAFGDQRYPPERVRVWVIADNCSDDTAARARRLGAGVFERHDLTQVGKGNALNEFLTARLQTEHFDALVVLDVDDRVDPIFLRRAAAYVVGEPRAVSCATYAKAPDPTLYAHVGEIIQRLLRLHQSGRAALGLDAILYGSHGYLLTRAALERLGWRTTTGQIAEDMELRLRCGLRRIPVLYAADLAVYNDVTSRAADVREQRRRWNSTYLPLIPAYIGPLLRQALRGGRPAALEDLFGLLLLPSFANLFLYLGGLTLLGAVLWPFHILRAATGIAGFLWIIDIAYFVAAFSMLRIRMGRRELAGFAAHVGLRAVALVEGLFYVHVKDWRPAPHGGDSCVPR